MGKFFEKVKEGLEDAIDYQKGKKTLRARSIEIPELPEQYTARETKKIRESEEHSQAELEE